MTAFVSPYSQLLFRSRTSSLCNQVTLTRPRRSYNPERSHYYHDAGFGYFAEAYREGFVRGDAEGYRSNLAG